ncbi:hypothetical protein GMI69_04865 [Eggerthellaceae bacterium zg-887]|uniref:hypothetical protein n=1 Tax=Xiamenia xianingshaonis TaxID=2682776 RepID=UPI00140962E8|nr:hypothetical protein [Xiamenia xianingshaonis]NHM15999.1 hypothetical protein [Xiamenia xianingshaonis]
MRRLYECAARYDDESEKILTSLIRPEGASPQDESEKRVQALDDFLASLQARREAMGILPQALPHAPADEDLKELLYEAKIERMIERELA